MLGSYRKLLLALAALPLSCSLLAPSDDKLSGGDDGADASVGGALNGGTGGTGASTNGGTAGTANGGSGATGGNTGGVAGGGVGGGNGGASGGGGGTGGASPIPTSGLVLWLRADQGAPANGAVDTWSDQSGNNMNATQVSAAQRPTVVPNGMNGLPAISFDGANDWLTLPSGFGDWSQGLSVYVISAPGAAVPSECYNWLQLTNGDEVDDIGLWHQDGGAGYEAAENSVGTSENLLVSNAPNLVAFVHSGPNVTGYVNASVPVLNDQLIPPVTVTRIENFLGWGHYCGYFQGLVAEVLLYNRTLSAAENLAVIDHLIAKWGCCG